METEVRTEGRIVAILDKYRIVVNLGEQDGIEEGNKLEVYAVGPDVVDPESGESLGPLEVVKAVVRVKSLQKSKCIAGTTETTEIVDRTSMAYNLALGGGVRVTRPKPLPVDESEMQDFGISEQIHVGDSVRKTPAYQ